MAPFITRTNLAALKQAQSDLVELKGYYDGENQENEYFKLIQNELRGIKLPNITGMNRDEIKRSYETMAPVNGVIDYIASNVGEVMRYFELRKLNADGTYEYVSKHWLLDALRKPNDRYNLKRFGTAWAVNRLLFDDAFVYAPLLPGKDRQIDPKVGMHVLPGNRVEIKSDGLFRPVKSIKLLNTPNGEIEFKDKCFESFGYSLEEENFFGTSKIVAAAVYLHVMDKGMRRQDRSLENGGPANIITPARDQNGILPSDADNIEREFNGGKSFNKTKTLRSPIEVHQLGSKPIDLDILASHKEAVTAICFVYHLPVDLYYGQSKYENAKEAKKSVYELQAIPLAEEFAADLINYTGLDKQGYELIVNRDLIDVLRTSPTETLDRITKMHGSLNELRTANGYDPIDEDYANEPMVPMGISFGNETYDISEF